MKPRYSRYSKVQKVLFHHRSLSVLIQHEGTKCVLYICDVDTELRKLKNITFIYVYEARLGPTGKHR